MCVRARGKAVAGLDEQQFQEESSRKPWKEQVYGRLPLFGRLCGSGERRVQSGREHDVIDPMVSTRRSATNGRWSEAMSAALLL